MMDKREIPKKIKTIRNKLGLTQEQLAQKIGVLLSTINEWENNKRKSSPLAIKQIEIHLKETGIEK